MAELVWLVEFRTLKPSSSTHVADALELHGDLADALARPGEVGSRPVPSGVWIATIR